jgi:hypothetical protein
MAMVSPLGLILSNLDRYAANISTEILIESICACKLDTEMPDDALFSSNYAGGQSG